MDKQNKDSGEACKMVQPRQEQPVTKQRSKHITDSGINQPHNAKKEALGPNTKR